LSQRIALTSFILFMITATIAATGYLRELILARAFGTGTAMDAFYFSVGVVQATHDLLFGAALTATIVPLIHRREGDGSATATDPARFTVTAALALCLVATVTAIALRAALPYMIDLLAPKMSRLVREQCLALSLLLVWLLPLNALMNFFVLVLNAHRHFILAGTVYLFVNVSFIGVLLLTQPIFGAQSLALASLAGPLVVIPTLAANLARLGLLRPRRPDFSKKFFLPIWRQARPILLTVGIGSSIGLVMIAHVIVRSFAANSGEGSIAALGYAYRLYEVPLSLLANPAAVLMLPSIAIMYKAGSMTEIGSICRQTLLAGLVVLFPCAVVTWIGADLVVHVLLERGDFGARAAYQTAEALRGFAPAIIGEGVILVFYRVLYAVHRSSRAVVVSCVALSALVIFLLLWGKQAYIAIALALSGGFLIGAVTLVYLLVREVGTESLPDARSVAKWIGCALVGLAACTLTQRYETANPWSELIPSGAFTACYVLAVLLAFADYRRTLFDFSVVSLARVRRFFATS
jgi:putative peptidoglycan lipid II flippase